MNNKNKGRIAFMVLLFFCFNNSCLAVSEEDNGSLTWQKWHPAVAKYIDETTGLIADTGFVIANYMSKPIYLIFPPIKRKLFNNAKTEINGIGRRLKSLQPPP